MQGVPGFLYNPSAMGSEDVIKMEDFAGRRMGINLENREDILRRLGRVLVLPVNADGKYRTPVVTLQHAAEGSNLYSLIERLFRPEFCVGAERFWKIVRADQNLDTWRPRVYGIQLKALTNCRLPELPEEFNAVEAEVTAIQSVLRPEISPQMFISELRNFVQGVEVWWEGRNARRPTGDQAVNTGATKRSSAAAGNNYYIPPGKQQHSQGLSRRSTGMPETAMVPNGPPVDLPMGGTGPHPQPDLGMLMRNAAPFMQVMPMPTSSDPPNLVSLNVGGKSYATTTHTLLSAPNSFFWDILTPGPQGEQPTPLRNQNGEIFIDRNGKLFAFVLEHLRSIANGDSTSPLPEDANELASLAREAEYYGLPSLLDRIRITAIMPQPNTQAMYDSIYLETGFNSIEGPGLKEMEQRKILVMQQMNHVLAQKALDGFFVAACDCGVNHRDVEGGMHHNLFYHILLKRVMPVTASLHPPPEVHMQQQQQLAALPEATIQQHINAAAASMGLTQPPMQSSMGLDLAASLPSPSSQMPPLHAASGNDVVGPPLPLQLQGGNLQGPNHPAMHSFPPGIPRGANGTHPLSSLHPSGSGQLHSASLASVQGEGGGGPLAVQVKPPSPISGGGFTVGA